MSNAKYAIRPLIEKQDHKAQIVIARGLANRALAVGMFTQMGIIRQRLATEKAAEVTEQLVGVDAILRKQLETMRGDREPPSGIAPRKSLEDRMKDCALQFEFGSNICSELGESDYDMPQDVPSRVTWQLSQLRLQNDLPPPKLERGTSLAALAAANQPRLRAKQDLEFFEEYAPEIVVEVDAAFSGINTDDAINYIDSLDGFDRYQVVITAVESLARRMERMYASIQKLRPGSPLAKDLTSELAVIEGAWKDFRNLATDLEVVDSKALLEVIEAGRNFRDIGESDARLKALGLDPEAVCAK